jgi:hypothetical protein
VCCAESVVSARTRKSRESIPAFSWLLYIWNAGAWMLWGAYDTRRGAVDAAKRWGDAGYSVEKFHRCTGPGR